MAKPGWLQEQTLIDYAVNSSRGAKCNYIQGVPISVGKYIDPSE